MKEYKQIAQNGHAEIIIKGSRFICHLNRVSTEQEALDFIQSIKKQHKKATHNCSAFLIGEADTIQRAHDDGEPSGTAGIPMLEVLKKNELHFVAAVVTRYFGGIKLGTGGLIRAYSSAVSNALHEVGIILHAKQVVMHLTLPYALSGKFDYFLSQSHYQLIDTLYSDSITYVCGVLEKDKQLFQEKITTLFDGKYTAIMITDQFIDLPLNTNTPESLSDNVY